ncbi:MAG: trypsin-like peptidase domain-containing protein [Candidatus Polarisedimenticolaceae bacterium]|nr:trypsin-like peptidase domain-containing protein [Candidatus Polarisedimenticolaceae bacterium]
MQLHKAITLFIVSTTAGLVAAALLLFIQPELLSPSGRTSAQNSWQGPVSYADAVARSAPSVVNIYTTKVRIERQGQQFDNPMLQYLFGNMLPERTKERRESNLGSGVIVTESGYVLTNYHILEGATEIQVVLADNTSVPVTIIGADPETDLAVLKIKQRRVPAIPINDTSPLRVGDVVLAIGNPFGVGQTVTQGIISATGRSQLGINTYENFIQTDAAINPGNSGGALINAYGELIGINTAIFSRSGGSQGIGFAIPYDLARGIMEQLIEHGRVIRSWLGISGQAFTPRIAAVLGIDYSPGIIITHILENGPGDAAKLRRGDVIEVIGGVRLQDAQHMLDIIANHPPHKPLTLKGHRANRPFKVIVNTAERPAFH